MVANGRCYGYEMCVCFDADADRGGVWVMVEFNGGRSVRDYDGDHSLPAVEYRGKGQIAAGKEMLNLLGSKVFYEDSHWGTFCLKEGRER